ncbi:MAG TPA: hypothetical protein DDW84_01930 [Phycisphaerales bacterium]|nr:MAG: hypothetical protein A2Y13_02130 [Planctomycetes bacterium GWC2_45_44]HBG77596.1 hypothetical protein [Phycisphaerales bacterium]HBR20328.1 hypothetical protein [Phycisphaerales bacterium]
MIEPLLWKEWHEQRWKLAFGTVMLVFFTGAFFAAKLTSDREVVVVVWGLGGLVLSLYSAMGAFAPEVTYRTKLFLFAKPAELWKSFFCKWFFGWLNFAVPMVLCSAILALITLLRQDGSSFALKYVIRGTFAVVCTGTMFYSMTCCFAPAKGGEAAVGITGLLILLVSLFHGMFIDIVGRISDCPELLREIIVFISPFTWLHIMGRIYNMRTSVLITEQAIIFIVTILIGLRKWRRS